MLSLRRSPTPSLTPPLRALVERIAKKVKKVDIKPFMIKNHLNIFVNCKIENPAFDSQVGCGLEAAGGFVPLVASKFNGRYCIYMLLHVCAFGHWSALSSSDLLI